MHFFQLPFPHMPVSSPLEYLYSGLLLLLGLGPPVFTRRASGLLMWWDGIQLSSYALALDVTAGPSAPTTETWSAGSTFFDWPEERLALSPPLPPRRFWGKSVVIQVL